MQAFPEYIPSILDEGWKLSFRFGPCSPTQFSGDLTRKEKYPAGSEEQPQATGNPSCNSQPLFLTDSHVKSDLLFPAKMSAESLSQGKEEKKVVDVGGRWIWEDWETDVIGCII